VAVLVPMLAAYIAIAWAMQSSCAVLGRSGQRTAQRAVARLFLGAGFVVAGVRLRVSGRRDEGARTMVSNHCSYLDVLVHAYLTFPSFVAKVPTNQPHQYIRDDDDDG
jgi:1-acyl-sn-glycerol-3-phosphate acyltransferase